MRWKTKRLGDTRKKEIFALFPRKCDNGETVWLEKVWITQRREWGIGFPQTFMWITTSAVSVTKKE